MKQAYGVVTKGNGEAWVITEKHMSLSVGGGQAGQGYPAVLIAMENEDETDNTDREEVF